MFLIGAPLRLLFKKGGMGVPIFISILFFIVYYVLSIMGEKYRREFVMPVGLGMWLSNLALLPAGLFFLYRPPTTPGCWSWTSGVPCPKSWAFHRYAKLPCRKRNW